MKKEKKQKLTIKVTAPTPELEDEGAQTLINLAKIIAEITGEEIKIKLKK